MQKLSTSPIKGFRDFTPESWQVQKYIFDVWTKTCESYGFEEYNGPVLEDINIYNKSGADVGTLGKELYSLTDRGDRTLAMRPEMTPSVGRMVAEYGKNYSKPIRWFSIAQFFRAENPQKGRGREFFQLNADIFGDESVMSDFEVINLAVDIMRNFGATPEMFSVRINNRKFTDYFFKEILGINDPEMKTSLMRIIDAVHKKDEAWFDEEVLKLTNPENLMKIKNYLKMTSEDLEDYIEKSEGARELTDLFKLLAQAGVDEYCKVDMSMARGFDYYTGMVFEVFDNNPENRRSMFGGGRYDDLLDIFGKAKVPAVGFAPGDMTTRIFLEGWNLLDKVKSAQTEKYYAPILHRKALQLLIKLATQLREKGVNVTLGLKAEDISKALSHANKLSMNKVLILGEQELNENYYKVKDMRSGLEEKVQI